MVTCPKCRKQNPPDAVFCGFCGGQITQQQTPGQGAKTVFGYNLDPSTLPKATPRSAQEPAPARAPSPSPASVAVDVTMPAFHGQPPAAAPVSAPASAVQPGLVAGKYMLGSMVRRLPVGELYQAKDVKSNAAVELLLVDAGVFPSPLDLERTRRELRQLQKVECSAIVRAIENGKAEDDRLYIVTEPAAGEDLDQVVARGPLDLAETQRIVKAVGTALAEAQKMGVIHRDIAAHNTVLCSNGEVKLRGFGLAAQVTPHVFGTPEFISPEQASGRPVDQRSNIYSLGALMFYMLTGEPPFTASTPAELLQMHLNTEPVSPNQRRPGLDVPAKVEALIVKALAKSSSRRHLTLRQFLREVETLTGPGPEASAAPAEPTKPPMSFVTPLHGVTALTGGRRPPSTELSALGDGQPAGPPATMPPGSTQIDPSMQGPGRQAEVIVPLTKAKTGAMPAAASPALSPAATAPTMAPIVMEPSQTGAPQAHQRQSQITGEMSSAVSLKTPPQQTVAPAPAAPVKPAAPAAAPGGDKKPAFRETMWFFKGEVESNMAETGADAAPAAPVEATPQELAAKYTDDGSLTDDEARRLSLRTGKTQMMQQVRIPSGQVPGEKMAAEDFISEMNRGRKIAIALGILIAVGALVGVVIWLVTK